MTPSARRWPDAALLGFAGSMRTFTPAALLAVRGRIGGRARPALLVAALGELGQDKTPFARERNDLPSTAARVGSGALCGNAVAGPAGAAAGAVSAVAGTFATYRARRLVRRATGLPDPVIAVAEDVVAISLAAIATREAPAEETEADPAPATEPVLRSAARGLAAGLAGTAAMTVAQGAYYQATGAEPSSVPRQVADRALKAAGRGKVPKRHRTAANLGMHWLYGTSWGIPLGLFARQPEVSGLTFGTVVWGASLVQLPALGLAPPVWKMEPFHVALDAGFHLVYGLGAAAALRALSPR